MGIRFLQGAAVNSLSTENNVYSKVPCTVKKGEGELRAIPQTYSHGLKGLKIQVLWGAAES